MNKDISHNNNGIKKSGDIDYFVVMLGSIMLLAIVVAIVVNQEWSENIIGNSFDFITNEFGIAYIIVLNISLAFFGAACIWKKWKDSSWGSDCC